MEMELIDGFFEKKLSKMKSKLREIESIIDAIDTQIYGVNQLNKLLREIAKTNYDNKIYWLLNGKQTGNYGVISMKTPSGIDVPVTNLERTLIALLPLWANPRNDS